MMTGRSVSVVIPTLNAAEEIDELLSLLEVQTVAPMEIIVIDSASDDGTVDRAKRHPLVRMMKIERRDFDHGGTRNEGYKQAQGEFVLFMTQDAVPADDRLVENLLRPFEDDRVALVSGRQLPKRDARNYERLVREFNYPTESNVRTKDDISRFGIKTFFSSDVCCMYRRRSLDEIGGIPTPCSTNEDMLVAARCLRWGMAICYTADAQVFHSHNLTLREQFNRNVAIGEFLSDHSDELEVSSEIGEGKKLVLYVLGRLIKMRDPLGICMFGCDCVARLLGNRLGRMRATSR